MTERGENFKWGVQRASLKGWLLKERKRQRRKGIGRASRQKETARVTPEEGGEQHGASVPKKRQRQRKGFEDQHKKLDSIPDTSGRLGTVVHGMQTSHASTGTRLRTAASVTSLGTVTPQQEIPVLQ